MNRDEYRQFLRSHGLTQQEFAGLLGHSARAGQYWATEVLSPAAATMAELISRRPELLDVVREIAAEREASPTRSGRLPERQSERAKPKRS